MKKYVELEQKQKNIKYKERDIYYSSHIDRYIYQYYGNELNNKYNKYVKQHGINNVSTAYRNCKPCKTNIHYAKEVLEFIVKSKEAFIFVGDFSNFFDKLNHQYLKKQLQIINENKLLNDAEYAIFKNLTKFTYVEATDIELFLGKTRKEMKGYDKFFETSDFQKFKKGHLKRNKNDYGIPQGSSISSVYANAYMIDFDEKLNNYVTGMKGMYRRYSDDIIVVIPMTEEEKDNKKYQEIIQVIKNIKNSVPNLELNMQKTEQFYYKNENIQKIQGNSSVLSYLGFTFDGKAVRIRDKSLFKFYCRAYKKIKKVNSLDNEQFFIAGKKAVFKSYTHLGAKKSKSKEKRYSYKHGNFLSYAYKAHDIFEDSNYLESKIKCQVKNHWKKITGRLRRPKI